METNSQICYGGPNQREHHIWCNYSAFRVGKPCPQCDELYEMYPNLLDDAATRDEVADYLQQKYFPDIIKRPGT